MLLSGTFVVVVNGQTALRERQIGHASHSHCGSQNNFSVPCADSQILTAPVKTCNLWRWSDVYMHSSSVEIASGL